MDAKKERSLSRMREEVAQFEPVLDLLRDDPDEMSQLQYFILLPTVPEFIQKLLQREYPVVLP